MKILLFSFSGLFSFVSESQTENREALSATGEPQNSTTKDRKERKQTVAIDDSDRFLLYLGDVLQRMHATFYTQFTEMLGDRDLATVTEDIPTPDLKTIIPEMRQSLLRGAKILFTGVIPTNVPPQRSPIWNTARAFGAVVHEKLVPGLGSTRPRAAMRATTHVIAGKSGTAKLKEARRVAGVKIVNPRWLWSCAEQWKCLDERLFPVETTEEGGGGGKKESPREKNESEKERKMSAQTELALHKTPSDSQLLLEGSIDASSSGIRTASTGRRDSRISVSDEELERMEAEVDAEMMTSSSSEEEEEGGMGSSLERSFEEVPTSQEQSMVEGRSGPRTSLSSDNRKRKHADVEDSSCSNSPQSNSEPQMNSGSSGDGEDDDEEDALAALLAVDST